MDKTDVKKPCKPFINFLLINIFILCSLAFTLHAEENKESKPVNASDPTQISTFLGIGPKYTEYSDGAAITELRVNATFGLTPKDMFIIQTGYGHHDGENKSGFTNTQIRHFHLFQMDKVEKGYRGWGSSIEVNAAGELKGMNGQTSLAVGASPAIALGNGWDLYPILHLLNSWDKNMDYYTGGGVNFSPMLVKTLPNAWKGAFIQFWPKYNRFFWGDLEGKGGGVLEILLGGKFTDTLIWKASYNSMFDKDFKTYKHENGFASNADQSFYFRLESYF